MYWKLFISFFRVGLLTFGGGYAMLPILRREVVEKQGWATDEELADYYAVGQCTPGIIMVNTATFIGYKEKGLAGSILASLSAVLPSLIIITVIAALLQNFAELPLVKNAFAGIRVAVVVLIFNTVVKLFKTGVKGRAGLVIFLLVFAGASLLPVSPVLFILAAGLAGLGLKIWGAAGT